MAKKSKSVLKRERQNLEARKRNRIVKSRVHTVYKKLVSALNLKNREEVEQLLRKYMKEVHLAVKKGVFHKNKGSRKISRIVKRIKAVFNETAVAN